MFSFFVLSPEIVSEMTILCRVGRKTLTRNSDLSAKNLAKRNTSRYFGRSIRFQNTLIALWLQRGVGLIVRPHDVYNT